MDHSPTRRIVATLALALTACAALVGFTGDAETVANDAASIGAEGYGVALVDALRAEYGWIVYGAPDAESVTTLGLSLCGTGDTGASATLAWLDMSDVERATYGQNVDSWVGGVDLIVGTVCR